MLPLFSPPSAPSIVRSHNIDKGEEVNWKSAFELGSETLQGAIFGVGGGKTGEILTKALKNSGRNSITAITKETITKLKNGKISSFTNKTLKKMAAQTLIDQNEGAVFATTAQTFAKKQFGSLTPVGGNGYSGGGGSPGAIASGGGAAYTGDAGGNGPSPTMSPIYVSGNTTTGQGYFDSGANPFASGPFSFGPEFDNGQGGK